MANFLLGYNTERGIKIPATEETEKRISNAVFPAEYCTDAACITAVKKQRVGTCWTFAGTAMMETFLLKNKLIDSSLKDSEKIFSETHMTYTEYDIHASGSPVINPDGLTPEYDSSTQTYSYSGNRVDVLSYFSRNKSSVLEAIDPNFLTTYVDQLPERKNSITQDKFNDFEVNGVYMIEDPAVPGSNVFINTIKYCVMTYGSVFVSFYYDDAYLTQIRSDPKYNNTISYYLDRMIRSTDRKNGHAVTIVGWDDNFPKEKFKIQPNSSGAFKVKNSLGTGVQDGKNLGDGYIWISYEDFNLNDAMCITDMKVKDKTFPETVYTNCKFGMEKYLPESPSEKKSIFSDTYVTQEDDEAIVSLGVCNVTPCLAAARLKIGTEEFTLFMDEYLSYPGFHRISVPETKLGAKGTVFEIEVMYKSVGLTPTYIPIEYKYSSGYDNLDIKTVSGSISVGGTMKKITDYNNQISKKYGNLPIYVTTKCKSQTAKDYAAAYKALTVPECTDDGLLGLLPSTIKPAGASTDVPVMWLPEPNERSTYDTSYQAPFAVYKIGAKSGIANTSAAPYELYMTAVIGTGTYAMKKKFAVDIKERRQTYDFTVSDVTDGNKVTIEGDVSGIEGATVKISCNNVSISVKTGANGHWKVADFRLYDPTKDDGWQDSYESSTIKVQVMDDTNMVLLEGSSVKKLERPFDVTDTCVTVIASMGSVALIAGLGYCIGKKIKECKVNKCGAEFLGLNTSGSEGTPLLGNASGVTCDFNGARLTGWRGCLFKKCGNISNLSVEIDMPFLASNADKPDKFAGIALSIESGSVCTNCSVTGKTSGVKSAGGLFYEGDNVTIENCTVDLQVTDCDDFSAIAHSITGTSTLKNISANVVTSGANAAGIAAELSGTVSQCKVSLESKVTGKVTGEIAGVCRHAKDATIKDIFSDCCIQAEDAGSLKAAGIAVQMDGTSTITNCLALGKLNAGASGTVYGIGPGIANKPDAVSKCVCVASFISGSKAFRISENPSADCVAYQGSVNQHGGQFISAGETLMDEASLLLETTFTNRGYDMGTIWQFDSRKCHVFLRKFVSPLYSYPFPNPYPSQDKQYVFSINKEIAFYGAADPNAKKITWGNLSPKDSEKSLSGEETQYMLDEDEFYLQSYLMISKAGQYTMDIISVIDDHKFGTNISFEIK